MGIGDHAFSALAPPFAKRALVLPTPDQAIGAPETRARLASRRRGRGTVGTKHVFVRDGAAGNYEELTVRRLRPCARRRARILRPFAVFIRARKPCTFLRRRLWG